MPVRRSLPDISGDQAHPVRLQGHIEAGCEMRFAVLVLSALALVPRLASSTDVEGSVVKIYATCADPYYYIPWITTAPYEVSGSGSIIDGEVILTAAHVVSNVTYLQVRREGDPRRYTASVVAVSHEADLALITAEDPAFFEGTTPLRLGELPEARQEVVVFGYPEGGDALSTTQGVISRIETSEYVHSGLSLLAVQIDAAINPGNSGGPAIVDGRIVGVAMQAYTQAENMGYIIPVPVIQHFFDDIADGGYDGFPSAGFSYQGIRNSAITERFGIGEEQEGILVRQIAYDSPADEVLRIGDVIMEIDGFPVAGDGTIELQPGIRTSADYLITRRQIGETIPMSIIRDGSPMSVEMNLQSTYQELCLVPEYIYDRPAEYYIFGGLVFMPLTTNYLESAWGTEWYSNAYPYMTANVHRNWRTSSSYRLPIMAYALPAEVNAGYQEMENEIVETIDGQPVHDFVALVQQLESAGGEFVEIRTNLGRLMVVDREQAAATEEEILQTYGIPSDRYLEGTPSGK
jgi:S1-C subfamily serine protease